MIFLVDMNLTGRWVAYLAAAGYSAIHWSQIGPANASDEVIMAYARDHGHSVLTHDLDFGTILALTKWDRPSVVQIRADDTSPESIGATVLRALTQAMPDIAAGALLTIEPERMRVRVLPFHGQ